LKFVKDEFQNKIFYVLNKLRLSVYLYTPSGAQTLWFGSVCPICAIFLQPKGKWRKCTDHEKYRKHNIHLKNIKLLGWIFLR